MSDDHISAFPSAWVARFADLPVFRAQSSLPDHDGDMVYLRQTAQQVMAEVMLGPARKLTVTPSDRWFYNLTVDRTGCNPRQLLAYWPADRAAELLEDWRCGR